jgi:hypothetical protein
LIRAFSHRIDLAFRSKVTFFVGENGSGKSTLLEALAECCGFNPEGGNRDHHRATFADRCKHVAIEREAFHPRPLYRQRIVLDDRQEIELPPARKSPREALTRPGRRGVESRCQAARIRAAKSDVLSAFGLGVHGVHPNHARGLALTYPQLSPHPSTGAYFGLPFPLRLRFGD